jgi:hypothetical protein
MMLRLFLKEEIITKYSNHMMLRLLLKEESKNSLHHQGFTVLKPSVHLVVLS